MKGNLPKGDQLLPDISMDELKALHNVAKDPKARDRLLVYMVQKRGYPVHKIADDFGSTYSTIRDCWSGPRTGLTGYTIPRGPGPRADWTPHSWR